MPSRAESVELMLARARAKAAKQAEAKQAAHQAINRPPPSDRPMDTFQEASARWYGQQALLDAIDAEHAARMDAITKHYAAKRAHIRLRERIREQLGERRWAEVEAARAQRKRR